MILGLLVGSFERLSGLLIGTKVAICFLEFVRNIPLTSVSLSFLLCFGASF